MVFRKTSLPLSDQARALWTSSYMCVLDICNVCVIRILALLLVPAGYHQTFHRPWSYHPHSSGSQLCAQFPTSQRAFHVNFHRRTSTTFSRVGLCCAPTSSFLADWVRALNIESLAHCSGQERHCQEINESASWKRKIMYCHNPSFGFTPMKMNADFLCMKLLQRSGVHSAAKLRVRERGRWAHAPAKRNW